MLFDHLTAYITVIISVVVLCPNAFNTLIVYLLIRHGLFNHCPMEPVMVCQSLSKFGLFIFIVSNTMCFIVFSLNEAANKNFGFLGRKPKRGGGEETSLG